MLVGRVRAGHVLGMAPRLLTSALYCWSVPGGRALLRSAKVVVVVVVVLVVCLLLCLSLRIAVACLLYSLCTSGTTPTRAVRYIDCPCCLCFVREHVLLVFNIHLHVHLNLSHAI